MQFEEEQTSEGADGENNARRTGGGNDVQTTDAGSRTPL
jgi:hypothetical protein